MDSKSSKGSSRLDEIPSEWRPKQLSPLRLLAIIASTVFLGEVAIMFVLALFPNTPMIFEALLDGLSITLLVTPALILFLVQPMALHIESRKIAEQKLSKLNQELEERVRERTKELTAANEHLKREISERKNAQNELAKSAEFISTVIGSAPCILAIYDVNSLACSYVNDSVTRLLGYSTDDVLLMGDSFFKQVFSAKDFSCFRDLNAGIASGTESGVVKLECELQTANNQSQSFGIGLATVFRTPENQPKDVLLAALPNGPR